MASRMARLVSLRRSLTQQQQTRRQAPRLFSSDTLSKYEYPLRTEAPVVTRTTAKQAEQQLHQQESPNDPPPPPPLRAGSPVAVDHFDDLHTLSPLEEEARRQMQKQHLSTKLQGSTAIEPEVPAYIPPNISQGLEIPQTLLTTLDNGVRVVSQETYGQVSTVGVVCDVGSRHETVVGTCHLLELLAFHSTASYQSALDISHQLQDWGATSFANTGREQTLYCLDILRPNVEQGMNLLADVVLSPQILPDEVELCKLTMEYQAQDLQPEILLGEVLQEAAYGRDQQLGKPHFCAYHKMKMILLLHVIYGMTHFSSPSTYDTLGPLEDLDNLNAQVVRSFSQEHMIHNPQGLVVAGAGIGHDELVDMAKYYFGHLEQVALPESERTIPSLYRGGKHSLQHTTVDGFTRIALAFELGGWHSNDLVPTCVLQTLLGGGNSFSAGGPGKGMYSRLYQQVLNRYYWAESAEAFTLFHNESGLFGMSGSSVPTKSGDMVRVLAEHFGTLAVDLVADEEFERARNMLKNNVLSQLESRLVLFEDMGRQVLTYGHREDTKQMCDKIDAVTKEELRELMRRAMQQPPTLAAVGDDLSRVPSHDQVKSWFQ